MGEQLVQFKGFRDSTSRDVFAVAKWRDKIGMPDAMYSMTNFSITCSISKNDFPAVTLSDSI
jgi:hypothetical protein